MLPWLGASAYGSLDSSRDYAITKVVHKKYFSKFPLNSPQEMFESSGESVFDWSQIASRPAPMKKGKKIKNQEREQQTS